MNMNSTRVLQEKYFLDMVAKLNLRKPEIGFFLKALIHHPTPHVPHTSHEIGTMVPTRHATPRDREEVRKTIVRPLLELGILEKVTRTRNGDVTPGHASPRSPQCAYRLTTLFREACNNPQQGWTTYLAQSPKAQEAFQASSLVLVDQGSRHETLIEACVSHWAPLHLGESYRCLFRDSLTRPRVTPDTLLRLGAANLCLDTQHDPIPDLVFWNEAANALCIVEAVTTEGVVDDRRKTMLTEWVARHNSEITKLTLVTAFLTWRVAAKFMSSVSRDTYVWVHESPLDMCHMCPIQKLSSATEN